MGWCFYGLRVTLAHLGSWTRHFEILREIEELKVFLIEIKNRIMVVPGTIIEIRLDLLIYLIQDWEEEEKHLLQDGLKEWARLTETAMIYDVLIIYHGAA